LNVWSEIASGSGVANDDDGGGGDDVLGRETGADSQVVQRVIYWVVAEASDSPETLTAQVSVVARLGCRGLVLGIGDPVVGSMAVATGMVLPG